MKETARSRKMNQMIRVSRESIQAKLSDEKLSNWLTETRDALKAKDQPANEGKNLLRDIEAILSIKDLDSSILSHEL